MNRDVKVSDEFKDLTFEQAMEELESTVASLESGDLTLEQSLQLFERGQQLAVFCNLQLEYAVLKVEKLTEDGEIVDIS